MLAEGNRVLNSRLRQTRCKPQVKEWLQRSAITLMCGGLFLMGGLFSLSNYATPLQRQDIEKPMYTVGDDNDTKALDAGKNVVKFGRTIGGFAPAHLRFKRLR